MKKNNYICHTSYLRNSKPYDHDFWYTCKMKISPGVFFIFFEILIFLVFSRGHKVQKIVQNDKKFCLLHSISQESYIIWLSFMVQMCKMIIPHFFQFQNFDFLGCQGAERAKKWSKMTKHFVCHAAYLRNLHDMIVIYGTHL